MSRDRRTRRLTVTLAALACATGIGVSSVAAAPPARAQQRSPGAAIADELRTSPVYVDPSLEPALPADDQRQLVAEIEATGIPIYVIVVPLVTGDHWGGDSQQLLSIVHDRLGRDGVFLSLHGNDSGGEVLDGAEWPPDQHAAQAAAQTVFHEESLENAGMRARFSRVIELVAAGTGEEAYEAATADLGIPQGGTTGGGDADGGEEDEEGSALLGLVVIVAMLIALGTVVGLIVRGVRRLDRRRRGLPPAGTTRAPDQLMLPRTVFLTARTASTEELRARATKELVAFGELVQRPELPARDPAAAADMQLALDAYHAGGKVLDSARGTPDLAGVLVLIDIGRDHLARASARNDRRGLPEPTPLCFFNPLHGDSLTVVNWRPLGTRDQIRAAACADCAQAVRTHRAPEVLSDQLDGRPVPYFEVPPDRSVWAATGYGVLRGDLVQRILRGDHSRTPQ